MRRNVVPSQTLWLVPVLALALPLIARAQQDDPAKGADQGAPEASAPKNANPAPDASPAADANKDANSPKNAAPADQGAEDAAAPSKPAQEKEPAEPKARESKPDRGANQAGDRDDDRPNALDRDDADRDDEPRDRPDQRERDDDDDDDDRDADRGDRDRNRDRDDNADNRRDRGDRRYSRDLEGERRGDRGRRDNRVTRFGLFFSTGGDALVINRIAPSTVAARIGFETDDRIILVNGHRIRSEAEFTRWIFANPRERVTIVVLRDGREQTLIVEPDDIAEFVVVRDDEPDRGIDLGIVIDDRHPEQVVVLEVHRNSPAFEIGVRAGDRIHAINRREVMSPDEYHEIVNGLRPGDDVELEFGRRELRTEHIRLDADRAEVSVEAEPAVRVRGERVDREIRVEDPDVRVEGEVRIDEGAPIKGGVRVRREPERRRILPGVLPGSR